MGWPRSVARRRCDGAETLRRRGYEGRVRMVCAEPSPPYDRPPLSKAVLAGDAGEEELAYRPAWWYDEKGVELSLGTRATGLDPAARRLRLDSGDALPFGKLLIATARGLGAEVTIAIAARKFAALAGATFVVGRSSRRASTVSPRASFEQTGCEGNERDETIMPSQPTKAKTPKRRRQRSRKHSPGCAHAKGDECRCRCGGEYHQSGFTGFYLPPHTPPPPPFP